MTYLSRVAALMAGVSVVAVSAPALAQAAPPPGSASSNNTAATAASAPVAAAATQNQSAEVAEVVVTGSRLARTTFETPTPVTAVSEKQLQAKAATSAVDLLRDIPQLRPNRNNGSATDVGGSTFNMRSLGPQRTLVLIDGQRVMNSSPTGGFDINILPAALISRMEIVTGGASSVYGSDAVTGVVNVFLDGKLEGGRADLQYDESTYGDAMNYSGSLAYGAKFAGGDGHAVIAASFFNRPDILYQGSRPWGDKGYALLANSAYTPTNGQYRQVIVPDATLSQMTWGGVITTPGALHNITFNQNAAQGYLQPGTNIGVMYMQGGGGLLTEPQYGVAVPAAMRDNIYARVSYDITPSLQGWVDILGARSKQRQTNVPNYNNGDILIRRDNAYLPANILQMMVANNLQTIKLGRLNPELGVNDNSTTNTYIRSAAGLKGELPYGWAWDGGVNYTYALYSNVSLHNRINANWTAALDSVIGPNGQPICRSTLTNPGNGCVPADPFGIDAVSPEAVAYVTGTSWIHAFSRSIDTDLNARGNLFSTWAGPISAAVGAEYRRDDVNFKSDPISAVQGWRQASSAPYRGAVEVEEVYGETGVPLAKDLPFAKDFELDLAGRWVNYSTSGSTAVWKIGANWTVNDQVRFRATYSRDFRAPTINELFAASTVRQGATVIDRTTNKSVVVRTRNGGNPDLQPEVAHTLTGGVVLRPDFIPHLQFSVDAFDINLEGAITSLQPQEVVDRCAAGNAAFCSAVVRDAGGTIIEVGTPAFNAQVLKTRGLDFELSYLVPVDAVWKNFEGTVTLSSVATYTDRLITISNGVPVNTAGQLTGTYATPKWRDATTITYQNGPLLLRALGNLIGAGRYDNTYGPLDLYPQHFPAYFYIDLSAEYDLTDNVQLYGKVENLLNTDPPLIADNSVIRAGAAGASNFYDLIGRNIGVGVRLRW